MSVRVLRNYMQLMLHDFDATRLLPVARRIKGRKVVTATRRLTVRYHAWRRGEISVAEFDASV